LLGLVPPKSDDYASPSEDVKIFVVLKGSPTAKWGERKIGDIRRADLIALLDDIVDRGAPIVANRVLAALRKLFNWTLDRDLTAASPCAGVKPPTSERARARVLTDDELKLVWQAASEIGWPFGAIVRLLILTGQRRQEVGQMTWGELELDRKLWTLPRRRVKNDTGHEVPLSAAAIAIIETLPRMQGCNLLFSTTGATAVSGFSKAKDKLDEKTGVAEWRLHDLRRTVASGMARLGIALPVIEKVLNHSSGTFAGIVGVYQRHSFSEEKRAALETWGRFVTALSEGEPAGNIVELRAMERA
jgi:integrase